MLLILQYKYIHTASPSIVFSSVNNEDVTRSVKSYGETQAREIFLPFRCFCSRKDVSFSDLSLLYYYSPFFLIATLFYFIEFSERSVAIKKKRETVL